MHSNYENIRIAGGDTAQPLALGKRLRLIKRFLQSGNTRFLDCGCGAGDYVYRLVDEFGLDAHGIEYDAQKVIDAQKHSIHGYRISQGDLQALQFESSQWDYAMLNEVLEHVPDENAALKEVCRILK